MRKLLLVAIAALLPFGTTSATEDAEGCTPSGTWVGTREGVPVMTITYGRDSAYTGTVVIDLPSFDATFGGLFPGVKPSSAARGVWRKTGGNGWDYVALIIGAAPDGSTAYVARIAGPVVGSNHCTSLLIKTTLEVFDATGKTLFTMPLDDHGAYPMGLAPPRRFPGLGAR